MKGIGIIIDVLAIILGGSIGVMLKYEFPAWLKRLALQVVGLAAILFGAHSLIDGWFSGDKPDIELEGSFLIVIALILGAIFGEALRFDRGMDKLATSLRRIDRRSAATKNNDTTNAIELRSGNAFVDGFTTASILCAFGAMTFTSTLAECLDGDQKAMLIKAAVDAVVIFLLVKVYGSGAIFAALPTLVVEGILAFIATQLPAWLTLAYIGHLIVISSVILIAEGINLAFGKRLRVINLIPAFFIGPLYWWAIKSVDLKK